MAGHITFDGATGNRVMDLRASRVMGSAPFSVQVGLSLNTTSTAVRTGSFDVYVSNDPRILSSATTGFANAAKATLNAASIAFSASSTDGVIGRTFQQDTLVSLVPWDFVAVNVTGVGTTDVQFDVWIRS